MPANKILVVGDVNGSIKTVFGKISALHKKQNFSLVLLLGNLFADSSQATPDDHEQIDSVIKGEIEVPVSTYFALGTTAFPEKVVQKLEITAGELCHNLYYLGKRTTIKTSEGIRVVALGGSLDPNLTLDKSKDLYTPFYCEGDAKTLKGANTADILVTSEWPTEIRSGSKVTGDLNEEQIISRDCVADLCATLKPRYHFSTSGDAFFEREPFFYHPTEEAPNNYPITRFISLGSYNNPNKAKWIYAFSLDPTSSHPVAIPPGATACPLNFSSKKRSAPVEPSYRFSASDNHGHRGPKRHRKGQRAPPPGPSECFFCLSNPNVATHLITSIGTEAYLTTAKGPLSTSGTFPELGFPCHMLMIPMHHAPTLANIQDPESRQNTYDELQRYRHALHRMLRKKSNSTLGAVTWEVSRVGGVHVHWQFLPVPVDMVKRGLVEAAFKVEAENEKYPSFERKDVGDGSSEPGDFFRVVIWRPNETEDSADADDNVGGNETSFVLPLDMSFRFDLQFGRRVLAKLLGLQSRIDWRDCGQAHEAEVGDAEAFKAAFKEFDFSLED